MAEDNLEYSPDRPELLSVTADRGVGLYVEVHMTEDSQEPTVSQFVQEALSRGLTAAYDRDTHRRVDLFVDWSDDQHLEAEKLKRWIATLPYVRLLVIEYAYEGRRARDPRRGA